MTASPTTASRTGASPKTASNTAGANARHGAASGSASAHPPRVQLAAVEKAFGGVPVLQHIDLDVSAGQTLGLIGPNGAGKTTLFNIMSGFVTADRGTVRLDGRDISRLGPEARTHLGVVRTFQKSLVFPSMTVRRNVAMAARAVAGTGYRWWQAGAALRESDDRANALLAQAGLSARADTLAADLSYGEQRMVDLTIALAQSPRVLLLDEPTAGLAEEEGARLLALVRQHHAETAVVLVSHDIDIVFGNCDRVAVLDLGVLIAVDTPEAIRRDARVLAAYLGMPAQTLAEVAA